MDTQAHTHGGGRDLSRIPRMIRALERLWLSHPDLRLGQLVLKVVNPSEPAAQVFYLEDDAMEEAIRDALNEW